MGRTWDLPLNEIEGESAAITLSTTADYLALKPGYREFIVFCASLWRLAISPALKAVAYYDVSLLQYAPYTTQVTDRDSSTHLQLDAMATGDIVYLGFSDRVLGVYFDIGSNANAETATLDVEYSSTTQVKSGTNVTTAIAFTDVAGDSDGSDSGGATLAVDGVYTWTLPSDALWKRSALYSCLLYTSEAADE